MIKMAKFYNIFIALVTTLGLVTQSTAVKLEEDPAVTKFRDYLRIPTVFPDPQPGYGKHKYTALECSKNFIKIF